jgi:3-oxoadipate enol-lactonase
MSAVMPYFQREDCRLFYETMGFQGDGEPLIFLNGTLQTAIYWKSIAKRLQEHIPTLIYDARGQGRSGLGSSILSLKIHRADLLALCNHLGIERAYLAGLSHGARLAISLAVEAPDRVGGMLLCGVGRELTPRMRTILGTWLEMLQKEGLAAMVTAALPQMFGKRYLRRSEKIFDKIIMATVRRNTPAAVEAHLKAILEDESEPLTAPSIPLPIQVLVGAEDILVPPDNAQELAKIIGGKFTLVPEVGHSLPAEAPDLFFRYVRLAKKI